MPQGGNMPSVCSSFVFVFFVKLTPLECRSKKEIAGFNATRMMKTALVTGVDGFIELKNV